MKNGILHNDDGYDIVVNGVQRSFRDRKETAVEAAKVIRAREKTEVKVIERATGQPVAEG